MSGVPLSAMRIASPFHNCGQASLKLFRAISPNAWGQMVSRVNGVNFMNIYGGTVATGYKTATKPKNFTWKQYAEFLLSTLPNHIRQRFIEKIEQEGIYKKKDYYDDTKIADFRHCPSWKAICITILKNDFTLQYMSCSRSKKDMELRKKAIQKYQNIL